MSVFKLHRFFLAPLMAFAVAIVLAACSSSEEAPPPTGSDTGGGCYEGDNGICCDVDAMQPGCEDYRPDL